MMGKEEGIVSRHLLRASHIAVGVFHTLAQHRVSQACEVILREEEPGWVHPTHLSIIKMSIPLLPLDTLKYLSVNHFLSVKISLTFLELSEMNTQCLHLYL